MADSWTASSEDYQEYTIVIETCRDFLALNLTRSDSDETESRLILDSCGVPSLNVTAIAENPAKYAAVITYPIFLLICTFGNILNVIVLARDHSKSVKQVYLIALAVSDFLFMWTQFFPYLSNFDLLSENVIMEQFINQITGGTTFLKEMFNTSSDWILVVFSLERFVAVVFPLQYSVLISKKRAVLAVLFVFFLAALYASFNLFDYYWFFYNNDPRCPPALIRTPEYMSKWHYLQEWAVLVIPLATFLIILAVNIGVSIQLVKQRQFRILHIRNLLQYEGYIPKDLQAMQMLFASIIVYLLSQLPVFVFNFLRLIQRYPFCAVQLNESAIAEYSQANAVLINFNYSVNFILYFAISSAFRDGLREIWSQCRQMLPVNAINLTTRGREARSPSLETGSTTVN